MIFFFFLGALVCAYIGIKCVLWCLSFSQIHKTCRSEKFKTANIYQLNVFFLWSPCGYLSIKFPCISVACDPCHLTVTLKVWRMHHYFWYHTMYFSFLLFYSQFVTYFVPCPSPHICLAFCIPFVCFSAHFLSCLIHFIHTFLLPHSFVQCDTVKRPWCFAISSHEKRPRFQREAKISFY